MINHNKVNSQNEVTSNAICFVNNLKYLACFENQCVNQSKVKNNF